MILRTAATSLIRRTAINRGAYRTALLRYGPSISIARGFAAATAASPWKDFPMAPPDPIIGLTEAYLSDDHPDKVGVCFFVKCVHFISELFEIRQSVI